MAGCAMPEMLCPDCPLLTFGCIQCVRDLHAISAHTHNCHTVQLSPSQPQ